MIAAFMSKLPEVSVHILEACSRDVVCIEQQQSIRDAARLMRARHVGALVVVEHLDKARIPVGMLTDRDIVVEVIAASVDPDSLTVGDVMSRNPITCDADLELIDAVELMRMRGVRRLPVLDSAGSVVGLVAADDAYAALVEQLQALTRAINSEEDHERRSRP